jgi:NitT/TauT family transport system substrate-binding protein
MKIYVVLFSLVAILIAGGAWFYGTRQQEPDVPVYTGLVEKVTLAAYEGEASLLPYMAEEQGFFDQNGLDVTIHGFESGKAAADALIAGDADMSTSASGVLASNGFRHNDLQVLGSVASLTVQGIVVRKDRGIAAVSDLAGKKVGVTRESHGEFNLGVLLTFGGLSVDDVEIVDLKPSEIVASLVSGEIDAGFTWEPNLYNAKNQLGNNAVVWKDNVPEFTFVLLGKKEWLDNNSSAAARFVRSLVQAEDYVKKNENEALQFIKEKFNYEQDYTVLIWQDHNFLVTLSQTLILEMEDIARWRINNNLTDATKIPNYLNYIYFDALGEVKPEVVTIVR